MRRILPELETLSPKIIEKYNLYDVLDLFEKPDSMVNAIKVIGHSGEFIEHIDVVDDVLALVAIESYPAAFSYLKNVTKTVIMQTIFCNDKVLEFVPFDMIDEDIIEIALEIDSENSKYFQKVRVKYVEDEMDKAEKKFKYLWD